jgi:hypothetical protein
MGRNARMAQVTLGRLEAEQGELPALCLRCGRPASLYRARWFGWQPGYSYLCLLLSLWLFLFVSLLVHRRMRVLAPWCLAHRYYGFRRTVVFDFALGLLAALMILVVGWAIAISRGRSEGMLFLTGWIPGLLLLAMLLLARIDALRSTEITPDSITLTGVAEAFVAQWQAEKSSFRGARHSTITESPPQVTRTSP